MAQHYKIDCDKVEDRKALVVVLVDERLHRPRGKGKAQRQIYFDLFCGVLEGRR